jgi:hypothetical protein
MSLLKPPALLRGLVGVLSVVTTLSLLGLLVRFSSLPQSERHEFLSVVTIEVGLTLLSMVVRSIVTGELAYGPQEIEQDTSKQDDALLRFWFVMLGLALAGIVLLLLGCTGLMR